MWTYRTVVDFMILRFLFIKEVVCIFEQRGALRYYNYYENNGLSWVQNTLL